MCGIIGYLGPRTAMPILLEGLKAQEYRGYDSAGIAVLEQGQICLTRSKGKIADLEKKIGATLSAATMGIGHTRWATHGKPDDNNAHPQIDCGGGLAVVHNGVIENYQELRDDLSRRGHTFTSQTDTEVLPHLIEEFRGQGCDLLQAVTKMTETVEGYYAMAVLSAQDDNRLICARLDNPLIIGLGEGEYFLACDMSALVEHTHRMIILKNDDIADITLEGIKIYNHGQLVEREISVIDWDKASAQKGGYEHFMLKEIHEQPHALKRTLQGRISADGTRIIFKEFDQAIDEKLAAIKNIHLVACGTAYHAGLIGRHAMEKILRLPTVAEVASEFQTRDVIIDETSLAVIISQSGETYDTILAMRKCQEAGAFTLAICNVLDSTLAREADAVLYTHAGPEIAVASTKAYTTQLAVLYMLTLHMARLRGRLDQAEAAALIADLARTPELAQTVISELEAQIFRLALDFGPWQDAFFIGRGLDASVAMEGALKLKEISYIHAEAYAAGELKHGTIALIVPDVPVLALCTQSKIIPKMISNIQELHARKAHIIGVTYQDCTDVIRACKETLLIPRINELLAPILANLPLQLLAYYAAVVKETDVDQPRNLAKSVTVG
ncbi:MAG: glutamine--fructose-6-phosphate transaminase (isomerizing) [Clostridia bacterium]|nr:glutamine--fructose-6-phosphate transaminase (isomerizing) [Clostridia bacterium]